MADLSQIKTPNGETYNLRMPLVEGSGSTAGTWLGTLDGLTAYYDGLLILYKPSVAGASTTTLNLNNLGAKTCYINNTTKLTTHFPVNQPILLVYSAEQNGGCWMCIDDYWNATVNRVRQTLVSGDANIPLLMAYSANTVTTTNVDNVSYRNNNIYANPSTGKIHATGFVGDLEGAVNGHEVQQDIPDVLTFKFESAPELIKSLTGNTVGKTYSHYDVSEGGEWKYRLHITEFKFIVTVNNTVHKIIIDVPVDAIDTAEQTFRSGWAQTANNGGGAYIAIKYSAVSGSPGMKEFSYNLKNCYLNGSDVTSASKVDVYVRKYLDKYEE